MMERQIPYYPPYEGNYYYQYPYSGNWQYTPKVPLNSPPYYQTPYEYYAKPKLPENWHTSIHPEQAYYPGAMIHQGNNFFSYFHDENGQVDLDKMFSTVGQLANTVQQITPVVKQVGSFMRYFDK